MNSLEIPLSQWKQIERDLKPMLDEIDSHRDRFEEVETRLLDAIRRLERIQLGPPLDRVFSACGPRPAPVPHSEVLDVSMRHALGHSLPGHRDMRRRITEKHEGMRLSSELLKEMHRSIFSDDISGAGEFRSNPSYFPQFDADGNWIVSNITIPPGKVPAYLDRLHARFRTLMETKAVHPILPAAGYMFEFFQIHPFPDGNGRLARLLLLLLLHQSGYHIGRYISIEGFTNVRRLAYLKAIRKTVDGWTGTGLDLGPWCGFVVETVRDAYREFSNRTHALDVATSHLSDTAHVIGTMPPRFTTVELAARLPDVPRALLRTMLNRLRRQGKLQAVSNDTKTEWRKLGPNR